MGLMVFLGAEVNRATPTVPADSYPRRHSTMTTTTK
jgi:hypothetical protein